VIDGEGGRPDFTALHRRRTGVHALWAFDLLEINGRDLREIPYSARRSLLERLIEPGHAIRISERFKDGEGLLAACAAQGLEGVVAKKLADPYKSGKSR
jgi:bifunctional non-homologous end joining protein LigD